MNQKDKQTELQIMIAELSQLHKKSIELLQKTKDPDKMLDSLLAEYERRLTDLSGAQLDEKPANISDLMEREKVKALLMYSQLAEVLRDNAEMQLQLKSRNQELDNLYQKMSDNNENLKQLNAYYLNMLGFVSHELRSPLVSILGFAELLEEGYLGKLNVEQLNGVQVITRVSRNLIDMIKNYLDLSKIENGELLIHWQEIDVDKDLLQPVLTELTGQLSLKDMKIDQKSAATKEHMGLVGDLDLLKVVFTNVFSNAVKYGKPHSTISYEVEELEDGYLFSIKNTGCGISKKRIETIFDKFSQGANKDPNLPRGTGLGLFNTKCIIKAHDGNIWAQSEAKKWFKISFKLPRNPRREKTKVDMTSSEKMPH
ncbi:MAG: sensor histidine kinase [Calditrichaeota bacterium]|nr:MAG: sensor histidine kinase [Calditrichota bacterium]